MTTMRATRKRTTRKKASQKMSWRCVQAKWLRQVWMEIAAFVQDRLLDPEESLRRASFGRLVCSRSPAQAEGLLRPVVPATMTCPKCAARSILSRRQHQNYHLSRTPIRLAMRRPATSHGRVRRRACTAKHRRQKMPTDCAEQKMPDVNRSSNRYRRDPYSCAALVHVPVRVRSRYGMRAQQNVHVHVHACIRTCR